jgi:hypothetical protein
MDIGFNKLAPYLSDPLILIGFFLLLAFTFSRYLIKKQIIGPMPKAYGYRILRLVLLYGFIIGLLIIIFGFALRHEALMKQYRTGEELRLMLKDALRDASWLTEEKKEEIVNRTLEGYQSGILSRKEVEEKAKEISLSVVQNYSVVRNYSNSLSSNEAISRSQPNSNDNRNLVADEPIAVKPMQRREQQGNEETGTSSTTENRPLIAPYSNQENSGRLNNERVYIWDFVDNGHQTDLTASLTSEFEEALIQKNCYQVLERRVFDKLLAPIKNEKVITDLRDISKANQSEIKKITNAQIVVFGEVYDDINSGILRISVSFQHFDLSKEVKSIRISRRQRSDTKSRENTMQKLVEEICDNNISQTLQRPKPQPISIAPEPDMERIEIGKSKKGTIAEGQQKEYKFTGVANVALRFTFQKENTPRYTTRYVAEIYDFRGRHLKQTTVYLVKGQEMVFTPQTNGWYVFKLTGAYGYGNYRVYLDSM